MSFLEMAKALRGSAESAISAEAAENPAARYRPLPVDHELVDRLGPERCRRQLLCAVELVVELADRAPWPEQRALDAVAAWWRRPADELSPVEMIVSAAHADELLGCPRPRATTRLASRKPVHA